MNQNYLSAFRVELEKNAFRLHMPGVVTRAGKAFGRLFVRPAGAENLAEHVNTISKGQAAYRTAQAAKTSERMAAERAAGEASRKAGMREYGTGKDPVGAMSQEEVNANLRKGKVRGAEGKVTPEAEPASVTPQQAAVIPTGNQQAAVTPEKRKSFWSRMGGAAKMGAGGLAAGGVLAGGGVLYGAAKTPADQPDPYERY